MFYTKVVYESGWVGDRSCHKKKNEDISPTDMVEELMYNKLQKWSLKGKM